MTLWWEIALKSSSWRTIGSLWLRRVKDSFLFIAYILKYYFSADQIVSIAQSICEAILSCLAAQVFIC